MSNYLDEAARIAEDIRALEQTGKVVEQDSAARVLANVIKQGEGLDPKGPEAQARRIVGELLWKLDPARQEHYRAIIAEELGGKRAAGTARPQRAKHVGDPVEHFRGEFTHDATDLVVRGAGIDFALLRTYRHQTIYDGPLGHRWDHAYNMSLKVDPVVARLWTGTGRSEGYRRHGQWGTSGCNYYVPPDGVDATLEPIGDPSTPTGWARRAPDGLKHIFEPEPGWTGGFRLSRIEDRWGNYLAFEYADGRLSVCRVNRATRTVTFAYDSQGRIERVADFSGRTWRYTYDSFGDLVRVTSPGTPSHPRGASTEYRYTSAAHSGELAHNITTIFDPAGRCYLQVDYGTNRGVLEYNRVVRQRLGHGDFWFRYETVDELLPGDLRSQDRPVMRCWLKERNGYQTLYTYNAFGALLRKEETVKAPGRTAQRAVWHYRYNRDGILIASRTPEGVVTHVLTAREHFLRVHGLDDPGTPDAEDDLWEDAELKDFVRRSFGQILATVQRAALDTGGSSEWGTRWGDVYSVDPDDLIVKNTYEEDFGQLVTTSDPRTTESPDPRHSEPPEYDELLTEYVYDDTPPYGLLRVVRPTPTLPDGTPGDDVEAEILSRDSRGRVTLARDEAGTELASSYFDDSDMREGFLQSTVLDPGSGHLEITTTYDVDELGRATATTMPRHAEADTGFVRVAVFDALDRVVSSKRATPLDTETRTRYEAAGKPARVEVDWTGADDEVLGVVSRTYRYNEEHSLTRETWGGADRATHFRVSHKYDASNMLRFSLLANDTSVHFRYDSRNQLVRTIRARGTTGESTAELQYDLDGRVVASRSGEGRVATTTYDAFSRPVAVTDPLGNVTRTSYDRAGNPTVVRAFERRSDGTYWLLSRAESVYDELGRAVKARINRFPEPLEATNLETDYEASPGPGDVAETLTFYDSAGRVVRTVDQDGQERTHEYDAAGRLVAVEDPLGNRVEYKLDLHGNIIRKDRRDAVRDSGGTIVGEEVFTWLGTYDARDRLVEETDSLGNVTSYKYDSLDRRVRTTDPLGNVTDVSYDVYGRIAATTERRTESGRGGGTLLAPATVSYEHDRGGNIVARIDALNRRTEFRYDRLNRRTEEIFPDGARIVTRYDRDDLVTAMRDPNGVVLRHTYDGAGRLVRTEVDDSEVSAGVTIEGSFLVERSYDGLNRLTAISNEIAATTYTYDSRGGAISETTTVAGSSASPFTCERAFDARGRVESLTYPTGRLLTLERDELARVATIRHDDDGDDYPGTTGAGVRDLVSHSFRGLRLEATERSNGVVSNYAYDGAGRLVDIHHLHGSDTLFRVQQLHDGARNPRLRLEVDETSASPPDPARAEHFGYDSQYQLFGRADTSSLPASFVDISAFAPATSVPDPLTERQSLIDAEIGTDLASGTDSWTYDLVGNRTSSQLEGESAVEYTTNARDEYQTVNAVSRSHDASGNLLDDGSFVYRYDAWRRLTRVIGSGGADIVRYSYDGLGRRVVEVFGLGVGDRIDVVYDGVNRIADYRDDAPVALYAYGEQLEAPVHVATAADDGWYLLDHQLSVRAVADSTGDVSASYRFDAFGKLVDDSGIGLGPPPDSGPAQQPFGYGGRPYDAEIQIYDFRARSYSPAVGRFLQRDPAGVGDGTNLYSYARNRPLALGDPTGWRSQEHTQPSVPVETEGPPPPAASVGFTPYDLWKEAVAANGYRTPAWYEDAADFASEHVVGRVEGGLRAAGGYAIAQGGAALMLVPGLEVPGAILVGVGADQFATGLRQVYSGRHERSVVNMGATWVSGSQSFGDHFEAAVLGAAGGTALAYGGMVLADRTPKRSKSGTVERGPSTPSAPGDDPVWIFRYVRDKPLEGAATNPHAAKTVGEHVWGREHLPGSIFESWSDTLSAIKVFDRGKGYVKMDLRKVDPARIAADLRTEAGRQAAAAAEPNPVYAGNLLVQKFFREIVLRRTE